MSAAPESPFAIPAYRRLFTAHTTALIGSGVSTIALALLAIDIAPDRAAAVLGVALAIKMVAYVVVAPFAGQVGSLLPPKRLLISLDVLRAGVVVCMPWIFSEWQIYLAIGVISAAAALFTPTYQALLPGIVSHEKAYLRALSWAQIAASVEQIASPLLAATLLILLTFSDLFFLNAATFALSGLLISLTPLHAEARSMVSANPWWGVGAYLRTPRLRAVAAAYVGIAAASAMVIVNTAVYVQQHLGATESVMALILAAAGLGTVIGALIVPRFEFSPRVWLIAGNGVMALALFAGVFQVTALGLGVVWLLAGFGLGLAQTPVGTVVRRSCHERHRAAFFAANFTLSHAAWLLTYLLAGFLGSLQQWPTAFFVMACLPMLAAIICFALYPQPDEIVLTHSHDGVQHRHAFFIDESHTSWPPR